MHRTKIENNKYLVLRNKEPNYINQIKLPIGKQYQISIFNEIFLINSLYFQFVSALFKIASLSRLLEIDLYGRTKTSDNLG